MANKQHYMGNSQIKTAEAQIEYTEEQILEYAKCMQDPVYFIETYVKVISLDDGIVPMKLYPYQKRLIKSFHENNFTLGKVFRQAGKSAVIAAYVSWYVTFNEFKNVAILANKFLIAQEIFSRVQLIIENLPFWLQSGVKEWNKTSFVLANGSECFCAASSPSAVRGKSINLLLLDEFAHLSSKLADEFVASVFPTISSGKQSKLIIISTPKGMNAFYKLWTDALNGKNDFVTVEGFWQEHPKRNKEWADKMRGILGPVKYAQEIDCSFIGSSSTLIDGAKIAALPFVEPEWEEDHLKIYKKPIKKHSYVCTVDTSRGQHLDYSAFTIFDTTALPYEIVATYKNNTIQLTEYPFLIMNTCKQYNDAYMLIEINDAGQEIANNLFYEFEYENIYFTQKEILSEGSGYPGVRTTKRVKSIGASVLKELIEKDQLIINSYDIVQELSIFEQKGASYAASDTSINDDLTTTLWLFAWLTKQSIFSDITNTNIRAILAKKQEDYIMENMTPFGEVFNGLEDEYTDINARPSKTGNPLDDWLAS